MKKNKIIRITLIIISILLIIAIGLNTYLIFKYDVLPLKFLIVYLVLVCLIPLVIMGFANFRKNKFKLNLTFSIIEFIYLILLAIAFYYLNITFGTLGNISTKYNYETKTYYVMTLKDSKYKKIENLTNKKLGYNKSLDSNINDALKELDKKITYTTQDYEGFSELFGGLYNNEIDGIVIAQSFYDLLTEDSEDIPNQTKILYKFQIKIKITKNKKEVDVTKDVFNIYISGIDTYGSVTENTRSDVNIIASVNPKTHKILMINIPRDYYVDLYGTNSKDKLTHAGVYGIDTSVKTLENLLDIDINYYVKVNYSALVHLVDALDGVEVYSEYNFTSTFEHYRFQKGYNAVNGRQALEFARTRKAFNGGDRVRGENQEALIEAIIKKASTSKILLKYNDVLKAIDGMFATNLSTDKITSLIKKQLDEMKEWEIKSISLDGSDGHSTSTYSAPGQNLYVMVPKAETIQEAKNELMILKTN